MCLETGHTPTHADHADLIVNMIVMPDDVFSDTAIISDKPNYHIAD
jgi:hypothetical protein